MCTVIVQDTTASLWLLVFMSHCASIKLGVRSGYLICYVILEILAKHGQ